MANNIPGAANQDYINVTPAQRGVVADNARQTYGNEAQNVDITNGYTNYNAIQNAALDPNNQRRIYAAYNNNHAKTPVNGRLNTQSYENTLKNSRQADALNNRYWWKAARIGHRTNSNFGSTAITPGESYKREPITTEEQRQLQADRSIDTLARQGQQQIATNVQGYGHELQKTTDQAKQQLATLLAQNNINLGHYTQKSVWDKEYGGSFDAYWNDMMQRFQKELGLDVNDRVLAKIDNLKGPLKKIYANMNGTDAPDMWQDIAYEYLMSYMQSDDPKENAKGLIVGLLAFLGLVKESDVASKAGEAIGDFGGSALNGIAKGATSGLLKKLLNIGTN